MKNKPNAAGIPLVQPGDALLQALAQAGLLRYLAVIHADRHGEDEVAGWKAGVAAALGEQRETLQGFWTAARAGKEVDGAGSALAGVLEAICLQVLRQLYPRS